MNRDDIIRMAREAGMVVYQGEQDRVLFDGSIVDALTRFAALVVQHKALDQVTALGQYEQGFEDGFADGAAAEREACAKVAEAYEPRCDVCPRGVAFAIRERGAP